MIAPVDITKLLPRPMTFYELSFQDHFLTLKMFLLLTRNPAYRLTRKAIVSIPTVKRFGRANMALTRSNDPLVWIDCEMTGLQPEIDRILQISCYITDANLQLLEPNGFHTTIHQPQFVLDTMSSWCVETHGRSGLTAAVQKSETTSGPAATQLLAYIQQHVPRKGVALLAGNSVHADRMFLAKEPYTQVLDWLHYRILDVSTVKEVVRRWSGDDVLENAPEKKEVHLAKDDILQSIEEMRYYRRALFGSV